VRERFNLGCSRYRALHGDRFLIIVTETWRDAAAQDAAKKNGKSSARAGQSLHNPVDEHGRPHSYAIDFMLLDTETRRLLHGTSDEEWKRYAEAAACMKAVGFRWSGDWTQRRGVPRECGHVEAPIRLSDAHAGLAPSWPELSAPQ